MIEQAKAIWEQYLFEGLEPLTREEKENGLKVSLTNDIRIMNPKDRAYALQLWFEYWEAKRVRSDHSNDYEKFEELIRGILDETEENESLPENGKPTPGKGKSS